MCYRTEIHFFPRLALPFSPRGSRLNQYGSLSASNDQEKTGLSELISVRPDGKFVLSELIPVSQNYRKLVCPNEVLSDYFMKSRL